MNLQRTFLGLPSIGLNILCLGTGAFIVCLGIRVAKASDIALEVANSKLITSSSAKRLEQLAYELEQQAEIIEYKDKAYQDLKAVYERSLKGRKGYERIQDELDKIEKLPEVKSIDDVKAEIEATEQLLIETTSK